MSIKFACEHCGKRLKVSSKQAGVRAKCPKCNGKFKVPEVSDEESEQTDDVSGDSDSAGDDPAADEANPYAEFVVYDDEVEWHYESDDDEYTPQLSTATDLDRVAVPRRVLYAQGILLAVVAVISFILGTMVAGDRTKETAIVAAVPCELSGEVVYATGGGRSLPDEGSVVIVLPTDQRPAPTAKAPVEGLRPGDPIPRGDSDNLRIIQSIGGAYARTDAAGKYQLTVPDGGRYFVLIVSKNRYRGGDEELDKVDIAQLGRYVQPPTELLGESRYEWRELLIRKNESMDFTF
ncbi:MAG: hypothetical protein H8E66_23800 [Planctomycetes bacterium]|nr:hypothetical protein [Planctomycetota bacterium]